MNIDGITGGPTGPEMDAPTEPGPRKALPQKPADGPSTFLIVKTETCPFCHRAQDFLKALHEERGDFQVAVLDANEDPGAFQSIRAQTRSTTVPQIFLDGGFVGGWNELAAAAKAGQLDAYLDGKDWTPAKAPKKKRFWQRS